jgi:CYTH domain-containing protein
MGVIDEAGPGSSGVEIERRWLLDGMPTGEELANLGASRVEIEQIYLRGTTASAARRVRRAIDGSGARFVLTVKEGTGIVRAERGSAIDATTYGQLAADEADPARRPIRKTRHLLPHGPHVIEIDEFTQPPALVLMEVELSAADEPIAPWPPAVGAHVVREVTDEPAYLNVNLALRR